MITQVRSHDEYLEFISNQFDSSGISKKIIRDFYFDLVVWVSVMDLTPTADLLKHRYSSNPRGRKPRNPSDMLRSLLLMHKLHYTSVDKWVEALKTTPLLYIPIVVFTFGHKDFTLLGNRVLPNLEDAFT